jgi:NADP-dependent 3-hydroxy acid dehydrogenase YdfG
MKAVIIGATGTIGKGIVQELESKGFDIIQGTRNSAISIDIDNPESVDSFFSQVGKVDAVICAAGSAAFAPVGELSEEKIQASLNSKFAGQIRVARNAINNLNDNGAVILTGGMFAYAPWPSTSIISAVNKGLEGFALGATTELENGKRVMVAHPPLLSETAEKMGMETEPWPNSSVVAKSYSKALESGKSADVFYVDGYEPK